jgi:ketosteroid isomerase-like protein
MMCVWDDTDDIVCVHPLGDVLIGRAAIAHSWAEIFASGGRSKIHTRMHRQFIHDDIAVHIVYEIFEIPGEPALQRPIIATNSYRHSLETGWRLILHHASPSPRPLTVVRRAASGSVH